MSQQRKIRRKKAARIIVFSILLVWVLSGYLWLCQPLWLFHWQAFQAAKQIVNCVEEFRKAKGRLPDTLEEVGTQGLSDQIFYLKVDDRNYEVWFSIAFGESEIYDSSTKRWN